jgi:hypothetical protein
MPTIIVKKADAVDLSKHYDADTLRGFTTEEYETRKRLYAERDEVHAAADAECRRGRSFTPHQGLSLNDLIEKWGTLQPLIQKYLDLDAEIKRLDGELETGE